MSCTSVLGSTEATLVNRFLRGKAEDLHMDQIEKGRDQGILS